MGNEFVKKRRPQSAMPAGGPVTDQAVRRQLAWASYTEQFQSRDPMFHITENFMRSYDALGSVEAEKMQRGMKFDVPGLTNPQGQKLSEEKKTREEQATPMFTPDAFDFGGDDGSKALYRQSRMNEEFEENQHGQGRLMNKFTEMTFMRGKMSAAVLRGTGNMMLFSCLKRTLGQSQPMKLQQRKLFQGGSRQWKPMNTKPADQQSTTLVRNEVFADSAIGLVFNVTKDARRTVDQMSELVEGGGTGTETWERMMPFLSFQKEEALLAEYQQRLDQIGTGPESEKERSTLAKAITRTQTLLAKKRQMRNEFMFKLRAISSQAREATAIFSDETFQENLRRMLTQDTAYPEPPAGNPPPDDEMPFMDDDMLLTDDDMLFTDDGIPLSDIDTQGFTPPVGGEA